MSPIQAVPMGAGALTGTDAPTFAFGVPSPNGYARIEVVTNIGHAALAEHWREAAEASGVLDFMRDDPLLDDYPDE